MRIYRRGDIEATEEALFVNEDYTRELPGTATIELVDTETPALKAKIGPGSWIVATSRRLLISCQGEWKVLSPGQVVSASVNLREDFMNGRTHKRTWRNMKLTLIDGNVLEFTLEGGESLLGMTTAISWLLDHPFK